MKISKGLIALGVVGLFALWIISASIGNYNKLVNLDVKVGEQFAQVDTVLQRRNDLIPNLVSTVKAYAKQETQIFTAIADARARLAGAKGINEKVQANNQMTSALSRLLLIVENYPNLKSNQNFLSLQDQLEGAENRISVERNRYNQVVGEYNRVVRSFPTLFWAKILGFSSKEFFKAAEEARQVPKVNFETPVPVEEKK
jgi:LemA protein